MPRLLDITLPRSWDTAAAALAACARAARDERSVAELHAASGLAFRLSLDSRVGPAGPHAYPWREELSVAAERLGYRWQLIASTIGEPLFSRARDEIFSFAKAGVDAGRPTLLFGVHVPEFGLVRGYDGDTLIVSGILDGNAPATIEKSALGQEAGLLFALQLTERLPIDPKVAAESALVAAVAHGRGIAPSTGGVATGESAYRALAAALESGRVDPAGLAIATQRYAEARESSASYLPLAATTLGISLDGAISAARRAARMWQELARLFPFPPSPTAMLTTTQREQAIELALEAARAESELIGALESALDANRRATDARNLRLVDLDREHLRLLFNCVDEIPIEGLRREAATCREHLAPLVGNQVRGKLLYDGDSLIGHILWSPSESAHYPVRAEGRHWFLFAPWLEQKRRGRSVGKLLFDALFEAASGEKIDTILTFATSIELFCHHHAFEKYGFVEIDRQGDTRLLEHRFGHAASNAKILDPAPSDRQGPLRVVVRHSYDSPLLLRVRTEIAKAARSLASRVVVDEGDASAGEPCGITVGGQPLPFAPINTGAFLAALNDDLSRR